MTNTQTTKCVNCGEVLQWFEVQSDGTCPICREQASQDAQIELFDRPEQVFINFENIK